MGSIVAEVLLTVLLASFALTLGTGKWCTLGLLAGISLLSVWHDLLAQCYYERMTMYAQGYAHSILRAMSSQMSTVLTYGLMIMAVGVLQIYFRNRPITYSALTVTSPPPVALSEYPSMAADAVSSSTT